jgi:hypothetical protein
VTALIDGLATGISASLSKHPVEETARRLRLLGWLVVVQWERVLKMKLRLRDRAVDMYKSSTLIGIVTLYKGLRWLFGEASR